MFQKITRRGKKVFLRDQCKELEKKEKKKKERLEIPFKKIKDAKGTFHVKMGTIKDKNGRDLTEAGDTKKKWQEYTEETYKQRSSWPR